MNLTALIAFVSIMFFLFAVCAAVLFGVSVWDYFHAQGSGTGNSVDITLDYTGLRIAAEFGVMGAGSFLLHLLCRRFFWGRFK